MSNFTAENLIPYAGTIQPGQRLLRRKDGTFFPVGVAGANSGSSMNFYKCASVDTTNHTWTGYKAVLNNGVYTFESTATTGLAYTSVTPEVGGIYSADAMASARLYDGMPTDGLIFYAPLKSNSYSTAGQMTEDGTVTYTTNQGIRACYLNGSAGLSSNFVGIAGKMSSSISLWMQRTSYTGTELCVFSLGPWQGTKLRAIVSNGTTLTMEGGTNFPSGGYTTQADTWVHVCAIFEKDSYDYFAYRMYVNSSKVIDSGYDYALNTEIATPNLGIGRRTSSQELAYFNGYIAAVRIYNRVLSASEIATLASEFTPTAS